jgi:hypothetical protein
MSTEAYIGIGIWLFAIILFLRFGKFLKDCDDRIYSDVKEDKNEQNN